MGLLQPHDRHRRRDGGADLSETGTLAGIAWHGSPRGPVETLDRIGISLDAGLAGDWRGTAMGAKPGARRQVSLIEAESWEAAMAEMDAAPDWWESRRNLLMRGLHLPRVAGTRVAIGELLTLEVTGECDPCSRMDAVRPGLQAALAPDWRGGFLARVIRAGDVTLGDTIRIVE